MTHPKHRPATETAFAVDERNRAKRLHERAKYDRAAVHAVLDASPLCHVAYVIDGQPYVTPTLQWRVGDRVYWHGSSASRFLKKAQGTPVCLTVSLLDGYVLARSAFHHSVNYRSAMVFGTAQLVEGREASEAALRDMVESLYPGRWDALRPVTDQELKATRVLYLDIEAASMKDRDGPPSDEPEDLSHPVWAGVIPVRRSLGAAEPDAHTPDGMAVPEGLAALIASGKLRP